MVDRQAEAGAHFAPAVRDAGAGGERRRRPLDRDRVAMNGRRLAAAGDGERLAIDAGLDQPVDGIEEIVAVKLRVEAEDAAAQKAVEQFLPERADRERFRVRPRDVPERDDRRLRQLLADHPRQQGEVIVLDQNHRVPGPGLVDDGVGEALVDLAVVRVVGRAKGRANVGVVTERPDALVGEAGVVALLFLRGHPQAPDPVTRVSGRDRDPVVAVDGLAVRRAAAVRDPGARARPHHGFQRGDESARRTLHPNSTGIPHVDVRLAVRDDDDVLPVQLAPQRRAQRLLIPDALAAVQRPVLPLEVPDQLLQVALDRAQLGRRSSGGAQDALATQQSPQALHPAAPGQLRDDDGDQRDAQAQHDEEIEQVAPRLAAPALDEAHVVNEHEVRGRVVAGGDAADREMQRSVRGVDEALGSVHRGADRGASDLRGKGAGRERLFPAGQAESDGVQPFVPEQPVEEDGDIAGGIPVDQCRKRLLDGRRDQARANVEIADEPAQHQRVYQRHRGVGERGQREHQRNQKAQ